MDSDDDTTGKNSLYTALLVLTIVNIVDVLRLIVIVLFFFGIHMICKRRARYQQRN
jgi:hypothetical protein